MGIVGRNRLSDSLLSPALGELFDRFPNLALKPSRSGELALSGELGFSVTDTELGIIQDSFAIDIRVPKNFPSGLPTVRELAGRIPNTFHKLTDGTLCLGSPFRLRAKLRQASTVLGYIESCVVPYLFSYSVFEKTGRMPFGELEHGPRGLLDEYRQVIGIADDAACLSFLKLLGIKKRVANKLPCPCGSNLRVGRCHNRKLNGIRGIASRAWFRGAAYQIRSSRS